MSIYTVWYSTSRHDGILWAIYSTLEKAQAAVAEIHQLLDNDNDPLVGELERVWINEEELR